MDIRNLSAQELSLPLDSVDSRSFPLCESPQQDGKVKKCLCAVYLTSSNKIAINFCEGELFSFKPTVGPKSISIHHSDFAFI